MYFSETLTNVLKTDLSMGVTPMLAGEPGIGKSSAVNDLAYALATKAFSVPCNTLADKADLTGARLVPYTKTDNTESYKQVFYPHHVIQEAVDYAIENPGETPLLFLDEINRTTSDVTSGVLTLVTDRKIGHVTLPSNLRIIVAGNDRGNVTTLDEASLSRFAIYRVEPDAQTFMGVMGTKLNPWIKEVLTSHPSMIFKKKIASVVMADGSDDDDSTVTVAETYDLGEEMSQITTPRTIENLSKWLNATDLADISAYLATTVPSAGSGDSNLLMEIIEAKVGATEFAIQLLAVISREIANGNGNQAAMQITVPRPAVFDALQAATTVDDLNTAISNISENERAGSLLFAMKDNSDNTRMVEQLAGSTTQFSKEHTKTLFDLISNQQINRANLNAFLDSDAPLATGLSTAINSFLD